MGWFTVRSHAFTGRPPKRQKYGAVITEFKGIKYGSKAEARRARELDLLLESGELVYVSRQPSFRLHGDFKYTPDFFVQDKDGNTWLEEIKGMETPRFRDVRRFWMSSGPYLPLHVMKAQGSRWKTETLQRELWS